MPTDAPWLRHLRTGVRARLQVRHVTQASLAARLGITPKHLNQVLGGHVVGSPDLLARMAEAVGLEIAIMVTGREPAPLAEDKSPWLSGNRTTHGKAAANAKDRAGRTAVSSAPVETNIPDRFNAWIGDPDTPPEPTLQDAFTEGFAQAMEWISGQPRERNTDPQ